MQPINLPLTEGSGIAQMPELLVPTFSHLEPHELSLCMRVSKCWYKLASADCLWSAILAKEGLSIKVAKQIKEYLNFCVICSTDEFDTFYKKVVFFAINKEEPVDLHVHFRQNAAFFIDQKIGPLDTPIAKSYDNSQELIYWPKNLMSAGQAKTIYAGAAFLPADCNFKLDELNLMRLRSDARSEMVQAVVKEAKEAEEAEEELAKQRLKVEQESHRLMERHSAKSVALATTCDEAQGTPFFDEACQLMQRGFECHFLASLECEALITEA